MLKIILYFFISSYHYLACMYKRKLFVRRKTYRHILYISYIFIYKKFFTEKKCRMFSLAFSVNSPEC